MPHVNLEEARRRLPDLVEAAMIGLEVVITKRDKPAVKLFPVTQTGGHPRFRSARGSVRMAEDFDAPLDDFGEYMQ